MLELITLPAPTTTLAEISAWTQPWLLELWPLIIFAIGVYLIFAIAGWIIGSFKIHKHKD